MVTLCHLGASLRRHAMEAEFDLCLNLRDFGLQRGSTFKGHAALACTEIAL